MSAFPSRVARGAIEGLAAGAALGACVVALESSPTWHVWFDPLSSMFRTNAARFPESLLHRLDTPSVTRWLVVGPLAFAGTAFGAIAGALPRPRSRALRTAILCALLGGAAVAAGSVLWRHRVLAPAPGIAGLAGVGVLAFFAARVADILAGGLRSGRSATLALAACAAAGLAWASLDVTAAARGPRSPRARPVAAALREPPGVKVAILALDGLDEHVLREALAAGRLPNLGALLERGTHGALRSIRPPKSPVVWTSIATGLLPSAHGIRDFVVRRGTERIPVTGDLRAAPALWDLGVRVGFTTAFVNWYVTWPAETSRGAMISDRADFAGLERRVFPPELEAAVDSVRAALDGDERLDAGRFFGEGGEDAGRDGGAADIAGGDWRGRLWGQDRRAVRVLEDVIRHDLFSLETARLVLRRGQPDLTAVYFRGADNTQHLFWKHRLARENPRAARALYGEMPEAEVLRFAPVVDRYYDFLDELVGDVLAQLEPETAVFVLSDHGFLANNERSRWVNANRLLEAAGLAALVPSSGGIADSAASRAFDPEAPSTSLRRRLRAGPRAGDAAAALEEARRALSDARTDRGDALLVRANAGADSAGAFLDVVFRRDLRGASVRIGGARIPRGEVHTAEGHSGDHRMDGVLIAAGPPFRGGATIRGARAVDLAPTILHLLGAPVGADMEGVVLEELFTPPWRDAHPVRAVESYGTREAAETVAPSAADERIREELQALGYIQ